MLTCLSVSVSCVPPTLPDAPENALAPHVRSAVQVVPQSIGDARCTPNAMTVFPPAAAAAAVTVYVSVMCLVTMPPLPPGPTDVYADSDGEVAFHRLMTPAS